MTSTTRADANKALVHRGFAEFAAGNHAVLDEILHDDFIEHSPGNPSGKTEFIAHITNAPVASATLELARVIADDEYVVVHYRMTPRDDDTEYAVADIWRIADGKIIEHWDVVQDVPDAAAIPHGMF
ncbi:nuclear transport factor 2 family protein [Nocardia otitidiscaviarum]|uniref:nuclear transport factor 2 family protein n=1 Tax=Nocardia otitidiscaviarum TaxID=1823 RepID=UPI001895AC5A|nr:nuclear transport factor 2 family protein [Nocardia otitidiscaviarum]MBF6241195.1 nuclear transport factor 2 family protein [Nocardia otitidiscaviarum]